MDYLRSGQRRHRVGEHAGNLGQQSGCDIQFAGKKGVKGSWRVNRIDWVPTANVHQGNYQWCPISSDHPIGTCWDEAYDAQIRQRIWDVIYSMGADQNVVKEWNITQEQAAKQ